MYEKVNLQKYNKHFFTGPTRTSLLNDDYTSETLTKHLNDTFLRIIDLSLLVHVYAVRNTDKYENEVCKICKVRIIFKIFTRTINYVKHY